MHMQTQSQAQFIILHNITHPSAMFSRIYFLTTYTGRTFSARTALVHERRRKKKKKARPGTTPYEIQL